MLISLSFRESGPQRGEVESHSHRPVHPKNGPASRFLHACSEPLMTDFCLKRHGKEPSQFSPPNSRARREPERRGVIRSAFRPATVCRYPRFFLSFFGNCFHRDRQTDSLLRHSRRAFCFPRRREISIHSRILVASRPRLARMQRLRPHVRDSGWLE
jgi:hypothetical protein